MKIALCFVAVAIAFLYTQADSFAAGHTQYDSAVIGGFKFRQYVTLKRGGPEILAAKGVLLIAKKPFSKADLDKVRKVSYGDSAIPSGKPWITNYANICVAIIPENVAKGVPINYPPLTITRGGGHSSAVSIVLITYPDAFFGWHITRSNDSIAIKPFPQSRYQWRWTTTRFEIKSDPQLDLDTCLKYSESHVQEVEKALRRARNGPS